MSLWFKVVAVSLTVVAVFIWVKYFYVWIVWILEPRLKKKSKKFEADVYPWIVIVSALIYGNINHKIWNSKIMQSMKGTVEKKD